MHVNYNIKKRNHLARNYLAVLFILFFTDFSYSQEQKEWLELGDASFKVEDYQNAIVFYSKINSKEVSTDIARPYGISPYAKPIHKKEKDVTVKNSKSKPAPKLNQPAQVQQYITHQLAESYRLNHDYVNAEIWYKKSVSSKPPLQYPYDRYWYGDALIKNKNYKAALPEFESIVKLGERKNPTLFQQAKIKIQGCKLVNDSTYYKKEIIVSFLDSVFNRGSASFSASYYGDAHVVQFTNASNDRFSEDVKKQNQPYDCDIYSITKTETGWDRLIKLENTINTDEHEASGCLSADKNTYYFTRWSTDKNECAIYVSKMRNQQWLVAEKLSENVNLPGFKSMHPFLSKEGDLLYFSSNRPGGFGKMDLWYVKVNDKEKTEGNPVNMGIKFNTSEDEVTPFAHLSTNTLFFSSDGLPGFGGLDVYKSTYDPDSLWSTPKNMGTPINSSKDDAYFVLERSQLNGFLSSDREECKTCSGGACYKIYAIEKKANVFQMRGSVYNAETNSPMAGVLLTFKDIHGDDDPFYLVTDSLGFFSVPIKEGRDLYVKAQKNGYFGDANTLSTLELTESQEFSKDFFLSTIPKGDIIIPGIEYEQDKTKLKPQSIKVLNDLVDFLNLNNNLKVEISSHTDDRGNDNYNLKLSQDRAKVIVNYLISKGIDADRLIAIGYGETQLLVPHAETEEEHQKNRRTVLRPIGETEIKTPK